MISAQRTRTTIPPLEPKWDLKGKVAAIANDFIAEEEFSRARSRPKLPVQQDDLPETPHQSVNATCETYPIQGA
jgi:hypothetical protein